MEITAPVAERLSLNASDCCFIKRKRNRFSNAERNRGANAAGESTQRDTMHFASELARHGGWILSELVFLRSRSETFPGNKTDYETTLDAERDGRDNFSRSPSSRPKIR